MREVILKISMPDNWVKETGIQFTTPIKFKECMPYGELGGRCLIEIDGIKDNSDEIIAHIQKHPDVCRIDISQSKNGILGSVVANKCAACRALTGSDCFLTSALSLEDGSVEWKLITSANGSLTQLIDKLEENGCMVEITNTSHLTDNNLLTGRQEEIIHTAIEKGYYNYPKNITIKELALMFDISPSTLGEIIQRGEKKIISEYFHDKTKNKILPSVGFS